MTASASERPAGSLAWQPWAAAPELLAPPVLAALQALPPDLAGTVEVAAIDPELSDTAAFCERYGVAPERSANCVVVAGKREGVARQAACIVLATTRADVNGLVKRRLDVRKASFRSREDAVTTTGMEYGGITPIGLPEGWPVWIDAAVTAQPWVVVGSGIRASKLALPPSTLAALPAAEVVEGLAG